MATKKKVQIKTEVCLVVNEYPEQTKDIYVCGNCPELGDWNCKKAVKMIANEKGEFELPLTLRIGNIVEYKYLRSNSWNDVECGLVSTEVENRTFTANCNKIIIDQIKGFKSV